MADEGTLSPKEAAFLATNVYFTLKDWVKAKPVAGVERRSVVEKQVVGSGGTPASLPKTSIGALGPSQLSEAKLGNIHSASTGAGTTSGFGYTMTYRHSGLNHVVIATRGTRPEMGTIPPDLVTDLRASMDHFSGYGPVHKGFKKTFDSIMPRVARDDAEIRKADIVHCVGHSLGGGVATLIAAHFADKGRNVKLYTFGCPRVGALGTYQAMHTRIGKENIYRVAHDLDPITLIGPFPYIHLNPRPQDANNMTMLSPTGKLISTANHDMAEYIRSVGERSWDGVRKRANLVNHDDALLARWLLHEDNDSGWWVQEASVRTLSLLFKLFKHVLAGLSTAAILGLTAVDLLAEILMSGMRMLGRLGSQVMTLLRYTAQWAGLKVAETADFTADVIKYMLSKMLATLKALAFQALNQLTRNLEPMEIALIGGVALTSLSAF